MKAPRFWYPDTNQAGLGWLDMVLPRVLAPVASVFRLGGQVRRLLAQPYCSRVPVLCIGNVVAGGAGKTPTALTMARLLRARGEKPVFVTRGYGSRHERTGKAPLRVDRAVHTAADVGDEALLLAAIAPTWVCRDRVAAIRCAEAEATCIVMDDGLQNPSVDFTTALIVVDGEAGLGNGRIIPAGPLREPFDQACARATVVVIIGRDRHKLAAQTSLPVFHAHLKPFLVKDFPRKSRFVAFAGIGRPEKFYATARAQKLDLIETVDFPDHHAFTVLDWDRLQALARERQARLLTTEKDAVRLPPEWRAAVEIMPVRLVLDGGDAEDALAHLCFDLC